MHQAARPSFAAHRSALRLAIVALLPAVLLALAPSAHAAGSGHASRGHVLTRVFVHKNRGAHIRARGGEGIYVPPGVMTRSGWVTISAVGRNVYEIHVGPSWHGTVAITLPLSHHSHDT